MDLSKLAGVDLSEVPAHVLDVLARAPEADVRAEVSDYMLRLRRAQIVEIQTEVADVAARLSALQKRIAEILSEQGD